MGIWSVILLVLLIIMIGLILFVRMSKSIAEDWHKPIEATADVNFPGGAIRIVDGGDRRFRLLYEAALALPRTELLAGSAGSGWVTFVTRSKMVGFPDYTTIELDNDKVKLFARLRFGRSDLGVNAKRLKQLIDAT